MSEEDFFNAGKRKFAAVHANVTDPVDLSNVMSQSDKARERARQREAIEAKERQMLLEKQKLEQEEELERERELADEQARDAENKRKLLAQSKDRADAAERKRQQEIDAKRQAAELEEKRKAVEQALDQDEQEDDDDDEETARLVAELVKAKKAEKKAKAAEVKAAEANAAEAEAAERKAAELKAAERKAAELKAAERKADDLKAAELKAAELKAAELKAAELKAAELKAAEMKAAELKAAELKAAELKAVKPKKAKARKHESEDEEDASEEKQKKKKTALPAEDKDRAILAEIAKTASAGTAWFGSALLTAVAHVMMKTLSEGSRKTKATTEKIAVTCASDAQSHKLMAMAIVELVAHQGIEVDAVEGDRLKNRDVADLLLHASHVEKQCTEKRRTQRLDLLKATRVSLKEALPLSALIAAGGIAAARVATHGDNALATALVEPGAAHAAAWKFLGDHKVMRVALDDATLAATPSRTKTRMSILPTASWAVVKVAEKRAVPSTAEDDGEKQRLNAELKETKKRYEALEKSAEVQQRQLEAEKKRAKAMAEIPIVDMPPAVVANVEGRLPELYGDFHRLAATTASAFKWDAHKLVCQFGNDLIVVPNETFLDLLALRRVAANSTEQTHKYLVAQKYRVCLEEVHGVDSSSDMVPPLVTMLCFLRTHPKDSDPKNAKSTHRILLDGAAALAEYYVSDMWTAEKTTKQEKDKDTLLKHLEMEIAHVLFGFLRLDARLTDREGGAAVLQNAVLLDRVSGKPTGEKVALLANELPHGTAFFFAPAMRKVMAVMWERYCQHIGYDAASGDASAFLAQRKLAVKKLGGGIATYASRKTHTEEETNAYCVTMLPLMQAFFPDALLGRDH